LLRFLKWKLPLSSGIDEVVVFVEKTKEELFMIRIGESLNVMGKVIGAAMKERNPGPIRQMAIDQEKAGVEYIDINMGPARKDPAQLGEWLVKTVQEVTDLPLYIDTINPEAVEGALKVYQNRKGKAVINSIMARPESIEGKMPLCKKYDAGMVALLWGPAGMPRDADERGALAAELMQKAEEYEVAAEDVWIDPIVTPCNTPISNVQVPAVVEFMKMFLDLKETMPGLKSTCGVSNVSNGVPNHLRPILNQTYIAMLKRYGMTSAILDAFDEGMRIFAEGSRPDIEALIYKAMDKEPIDRASLTKEQLDYVKTTDVLMAYKLFSDDWLDL
jgi:5-methyltetrahydrofolate corrinoid/iron sulfur protein methyltransferase